MLPNPLRLALAAAALSLLATAQAGERDASHDFDFNAGAWKTQIRRLAAPGRWVDLEGTVVVSDVWNGKAQLEEIEADGASGPFEGLTLFVRNPATNQWSEYFANSRVGILGTPTIGGFDGKRGEFYGYETRGDRPLFVRGVWSDIHRGSHRFEQSLSRDGGKTWESDFVARLTRITAPAARPAAPDRDRSFDFEMGTWDAHIHRLRHPLAGAPDDWVDYDGRVVVRPVWGGRANLAEVTGEGPDIHTEFLVLRLYNPKSRQWSMSFTASRSGVIDAPLVGDYSTGHGEFYGPDTFNDRAILVRLLLFPGTDTWRSEQAFSADGGKTWETNWVTTYKRVRG